MGTEAVWVPLVLAAVGAGTSYVNTRNTNRRLENESLTRILNQQGRQREADVEVQKLIQDTAASNPEARSAEALEGYTSELRRSQGQQTSGIDNLAGASQAYKDMAAKGASGVSEYGGQLASLFSRIDGALRQREDEGVDRMDAQNRIDMISRRSAGQDHLSDLRLQSIGPNPLLTAASEIAYGMSQGGGYGGKSAAKGPGGKKLKKVAV